MVRVVDASVGIKWFIKEDHSEQALECLQELFIGPESFAVPELFFFELVHTFNRLVASPNSTHLELLEMILVLPVRRFSMTSEMMREMKYFQNRGLSGYDAAYIALAKLTNGRWLTADKKAYKLVANEKLSMLLGD